MGDAVRFFQQDAGARLSRWLGRARPIPRASGVSQMDEYAGDVFAAATGHGAFSSERRLPRLGRPRRGAEAGARTAAENDRRPLPCQAAEGPSGV